MPRKAIFKASMEQNDDNEVIKLLEEYEILPATAATLEKAGFVTIKAISLLTKETISTEQTFKELSLAQKMLLTAAVESLHSKAPSTETCRSKENDTEELIQMWANMNVSGASGPQQATTATTTCKSNQKDITSYVTLHPGQTSEHELRVVDGHISVANKRTPREKLTIPQYMEASIKMRSTLPPHQLNDYCDYLTKIAQLAQVFTWPSVLLYDKEFRRKQTETGGQWSSEEPYLMSLCLRPISNTSNTPNPPNNKKSQSRMDPTSGKPVCIRFNKSMCTTDACRYAHVCMTCLGPHPDTKHPRAKNGQQS